MINADPQAWIEIGVELDSTSPTRDHGQTPPRPERERMSASVSVSSVSRSFVVSTGRATQPSQSQHCRPVGPLARQFPTRVGSILPCPRFDFPCHPINTQAIVITHLPLIIIIPNTKSSPPAPNMPTNQAPPLPPLSSGAPARSDDLTSDGIWLHHLLHARHHTTPPRPAQHQRVCVCVCVEFPALPCHCLTATTGTPCRASCHSQNDPKLRADGATVPTAEALTPAR